MGEGFIRLLATPLLKKKQNIKKNLQKFEYYCRNKYKRSRQLPHCNFYFVALLIFPF